MCDPRTPPTMGCGVSMWERWHNRSAHGPVALMIQVPSTLSSFPVSWSRKSTAAARR